MFGLLGFFQSFLPLLLSSFAFSGLPLPSTFSFQTFFVSFSFSNRDEHCQGYDLGYAHFRCRRGGIQFCSAELLVRALKDGLGSAPWVAPNPPRFQLEVLGLEDLVCLPLQARWASMKSAFRLSWAPPPYIFYSSFLVSGYVAKFDCSKLIMAYL